MINNKNTIVFVIFTCNRFYYFKNAFESLCACIDMDRIKILIVDNGTVEKGFEEYLNKISCFYGPKIIIKRFKNRIVGELYRAMNWSIKWCFKNKIDIIYFLQDDFQFIFPNKKLLDEVVNIFNSHSKIVQINSNLAWKRKNKRVGKLKFFNANKIKYAILESKRPCDNGFTRVGIYKNIGLYPKKLSFKKRESKSIVGESWFGRACTKRKWKRAISFFPNMGMIFSASFIRGGKRYGDYFKPPNKYYIKMFNDLDISKIRLNHDNKKWSFADKLCEADGWVPKVLYKRDDKTTIINNVSTPARDYL